MHSKFFTVYIIFKYSQIKLTTYKNRKCITLTTSTIRKKHKNRNLHHKTELYLLSQNPLL